VSFPKPAEPDAAPDWGRHTDFARYAVCCSGPGR